MTIRIETRPIGESIITASGRRFWPLDPRPEDVDIEDIAHGLSRKARYCGHVPDRLISVAEHSLAVADLLAGTPAELCGLLHDAAEAYLPDVCAPIKHAVMIRGMPFAVAEERIMACVYRRYGIVPPSPAITAAIHGADLAARAAEMADDRAVSGLHAWTAHRDAFLARFRTVLAFFCIRH
jgi:hypothetical protein